MKQLLINKRVSIFWHLLLAVSVLPLVLTCDKNESLLFINSRNFPFLDIVMYHITRLPELASIVFVIVLSAFFERRIFLSVLVSMSLCGLLILLCKHVLFTDFERPFQWLNANHVRFHAVEGIRLHSTGSFPSGHTIAAFCSLALVGFMSKSPLLQSLLFLLACGMAYSRVYVAQHYLRDVYTGAILGYLIAISVYTLFQKRFKTPYWQKLFITFKK